MVHELKDLEDLLIELVYVGRDNELHIDRTFYFHNYELSSELDKKLRDIVDA